ncbi:hypothetical protein ACHAWU_008883 [Discostella pseudostelligera]|uniref:WW domain-containing protein n=1 Tax=Discostella pseudostelligera TaxID=259834 RepID=A0ABD3N006_9STRA
MAEDGNHHDPADNPPPLFKDTDVMADDDDDDDDDDAADDYFGSGDNDERNSEDGGDDYAAEAADADDVADGEDIGNGWVAYKDDENRTYYYHVETGETQWDRPEIGVEPVEEMGVEEMEEENDAHDATTATAADDKVTPVAIDDSVDENKGTSREDISPTVGVVVESLSAGAVGDDDLTSHSHREHPLSKDDEPIAEEPSAEAKITAAMAEKFLQQPDAVMEPNVLDHIDILVQELGPQEAGPKAMQSLINGYSGDTAICGLLGLWLAQLKSSSSSSTGHAINVGNAIGTNTATAATTTSVVDAVDRDGIPPLRPCAADTARDVVERVIHQLAKERFTKNYGDAIVKLPKKEAAFIDKMITSSRWRKLLIDLSASNRDSKLFMYCLQSISNLGHHREIANRINQAEYFGVFNSMLQSELTITAKLSVDGYRRDIINDAMDATKGPMGSLVADLRRTCTSTSYTYLYAMEVLKVLLSKSKQMLSDGKCTHPEYLKRSIRKWERLREELEEEMLTPIKTGTTFQRKRKIDVALTMSDLFQRKRRRVDPRADNVNGDGVYINRPVGTTSSTSDLEDTLDSAISQLLMKSSLGIQLDKESADSVLKYAYGGSTDRIGDLLVEHPTAVAALLNHLFGHKQRIRQLETRLKFARLLALAVTASERAASRLSNGEQATITESDDDDALTQVILKGSQLCEQLENMVSFTVLDNLDQSTEGSAGRQLSALCIRHSVVAVGALIWSKQFAGVPDFASTASYPTITPCILSLARLICRHQPLTRPAVLEMSLIFLGHSNREISHRTMQSIKEQSLRLMLWLSTQGLSLSVISAVQNKLEKVGSTDMDAALLRYFFAGLIEIVRPPLSLPFVRALGGLMLKRPCLDALQSVHFEASRQQQIKVLINQFEAAGDNNELWEEDKNLLSTLKSAYCRDS